MDTNEEQKIPENIQNSIDNIEKLIREDKDEQRNDKYKDFIYNILDKNQNDGIYNKKNNTYEYELTKGETQILMYNISIIHYLIELKKLEIEKIILNIDKDYVLLVKLKEKTDDVFIVKKKGCPSLKFKFPDKPLTNIDKLIEKQKEIYNEINKIKSANQTGGVGDNKFMNHLTKVGKLTNGFNSPYQITNNSKDIYNKLKDYDEESSNEFKKNIIEVETPISFSQEKQGEIQNLIDTLKVLSDLYYQYHKIFINLVLIYITLLQLNKQTSKVINEQILIIKEKLPKKIVSDTVAISDDCTIIIPNLKKLHDIIRDLEKKQNIILEINNLDKKNQNKLKKILAEYKDDFLINNGGEVKTNNEILIL